MYRTWSSTTQAYTPGAMGASVVTCRRQKGPRPSGSGCAMPLRTAATDDGVNPLASSSRTVAMRPVSRTWRCVPVHSGLVRQEADSYQPKFLRQELPGDSAMKTSTQNLHLSDDGIYRPCRIKVRPC